MAGRDLLIIPNLKSVGLDVTITGDNQLLVVDLHALQTVGGNINISGNLAMTSLNLSALNTVNGGMMISGNPLLSAVLVSGVTSVGGDLSIIGTAATVINLHALTRAGSVNVSGNTAATIVDFGSLTTVRGSVTASGNTAATVVDFGSLSTVKGDLTVTNNGPCTAVTVGSLTSVTGDLAVESCGSGTFATGDAVVGGNTTLTTVGYTTVTGKTATGSTTVSNAGGGVVMRLQIPAATFVTPVSFSLSPIALTPESGTAADGGAASVDPVAAYQFTFGVPTLNHDATLSFDVSVASLAAATRTAFLAALDAGTATMATKADTAGSSYQAFPLCAGSGVPTGGGCVLVQKLDANGRPTTGTPAVVRFSNVVGHFSRWAVAIVTPLAPPADTTPPVITVAAAPAILWPPNGKMVPVTISGTMTDAGSGVNASSAT